MGVGTFEIVLGPEEPLPSRLTLSPRDRPQRIETSRDGGEKALFGLHIGRDRAEQRRLRLIGAIGAPQPLDRRVGLPTGFQEVVDAKAPIPSSEIGVVRAPRAAGVGEYEDALLIVHERLRLAQISGGGPVLDGEAGVAVGPDLAHDASCAAGDLRDHIGSKTLDDLIECAMNWGHGGQTLDEARPSGDGLLRVNRLAVLEDRAGSEIALVVRERLIELGRKTVLEIVEHIFPRRDVDLNIPPFLRRDLRKPSLRQRRAGGDELNDAGVPRGKIALDRRDQRRRLHRGDEVIEKALLGAFERRSRGGLGLAVQRSGFAGDIRRLESRVEIVVDDGEGASIRVIDRDLLVGEPMLEQFVVDAVIGKRSGGIEAQRFQIAREHLHRGDAASLDRLDEFRTIGEGERIVAPEAEPLGVGEVLDRRRPGRRDIEDAGVGKSMLQPQARPTLLRGLDIAALAFTAARVLHGVAFVEDDDAVEFWAEPVDDLTDPRALIAARFRTQRRIGREENALVETDRRSRSKAGLWGHQEPFLAQRRPIALGVLDQLVGLADPNRATTAFEPIVEQYPRDLAALARPRAVAQKPAASKADGVRGIIRRRRRGCRRFRRRSTRPGDASHGLHQRR